MPGSVSLAVPLAVLPFSLAVAFSHQRDYAVLVNDYPNGDSQRSLVSTAVTKTSRKRWKLSLRLTTAKLSALRDFYDARRGGLEPFYFYDPWDTSPRFTHDPTGAAVAGRYTVRFEGGWQQVSGLGRPGVDIALVELA